MVSWFVQMHRRNRRSWDGIVARMSPECRIRWTASSPARAEALAAIWVRSPHAALQDSGALLAMADYAERNGESFDAARLAMARTAAVQLRMAAMRNRVRQILLR